jgi:DNA-binding winged helix-turn-helix (wHTH) protein
MKPYAQVTGHQFASFRLDHVNQCLWQGTVQIPLSPKAFSVLLYLVERSRELVTKQELLDAVWPDVHVTEGVLKRAILEIRKALADPIDEPRFIQTLHRRGYRFMCPATETGGGETTLCESSVSQEKLIGREPECRQLDTWLRDAQAGSRQVVFVTGETGLGKTTLVEHWMRSVAGSGSAVFGRGRCVQHPGNEEAYLPVLEALEQLGVALGRKFIDVFRAYAPGWLLQLPALMSPEDRRNVREEVLEPARAPILREIANALEVLSQDSPLVLVLEDLHWSDAATIVFLTSIARRTSPARLMVLATFRTAGSAGIKSSLLAAKNELELHRQCHELALRPLTEHETGEYVESRFPGLNSPTVASVLHSRTAGNPLCLVCLVDQLSRSGRMESDTAVIRETVPEALQLLFKRQAAELDRAEQQVLDAAALAGESFSAGAVAAALGWDEEDAEAVCDNLAQREGAIRRSPAGGYSFVNGLSRDSLRIPLGQRSQPCRSVAGARERVPAAATRRASVIPFPCRLAVAAA